MIQSQYILLSNTIEWENEVDIVYLNTYGWENVEDITEPMMIITPFSYSNRYAKANLSVELWSADEGIVNKVNYKEADMFGWSRQDIESYMEGEPIVWLNDPVEAFTAILWRIVPLVLLVIVLLVVCIVAYRQYKIESFFLRWSTRMKLTHTTLC